MSKKCTDEMWLRVIELYKARHSSLSISKAVGLDEREIRHRCRQYDLCGYIPEPRSHAFRASRSLKRKAVDAIAKESLSYAETTLKYNISRNTLKVWLKAFRHGGYEELFATKTKGRPPQMGRPMKIKKAPQTDLEKVLRENELLRAENALLKKVRALVEERIAREQGNGR